jgi:hypothetical protein
MRKQCCLSNSCCDRVADATDTLSVKRINIQKIMIGCDLSASLTVRL